VKLLSRDKFTWNASSIVLLEGVKTTERISYASIQKQPFPFSSASSDGSRENAQLVSITSPALNLLRFLLSAMAAKRKAFPPLPLSERTVFGL
jgi:hypothetical protein